MGAGDRGDTFRGVERHAGVCGGDPVIAGTRVPVWLLEQARRRGAGEAELLRAYPMLRPEDLASAWAYARSHATEIDGQSEANESDDAA